MTPRPWHAEARTSWVFIMEKRKVPAFKALAAQEGFEGEYVIEQGAWSNRKKKFLEQSV
jgi:hypothetical protein